MRYGFFRHGSDWCSLSIAEFCVQLVLEGRSTSNRGRLATCPKLSDKRRGGTRPVSHRCECRGADYTDTNGNLYQADTFDAGNIYSRHAWIAGTVDDVLYQSNVWKSGGFIYEFAGLLDQTGVTTTTEATTCRRR